MGLVDYSESDSSDSETQPQPKAPQPKKASAPSTGPTKKPFQKVVDRSNPGKIVVSLPSAAPADSSRSEEPPAKRARTGGSGLFSGFNSFLPPPKNANKPATGGGGGGGTLRPKPGVNLKTSAAPGFSREHAVDGVLGDDGEAPKPSGGMSLPPPKKQAEPSIPEGQKAAEEVKLVGKPLMFRPLSVSRNPNKKKKPAIPKSTATPAATGQPQPANGTSNPTETPAAAPPPPKKASLFSMHTEEAPDPSSQSSENKGAYEPLFETQDAGSTNPYEAYDHAAQAQQGIDNNNNNLAAAAGLMPTTGGIGTDSLGDIANDMNLSAAERRELFGRSGAGGHRAARVVNFNMDTEYQHNEELRASGQEQIHNPVRALQGGGKHNLRQLVHNVQSQKDALEDSFAKGKSNRKQASSRYGW